MSIDGQVDKNVVVHIYHGLLLGCKKNEILPVPTTWMRVMVSEISQTEKDKDHIISLICGI